jgi:hypothetical protein
MSVNRKVSVCVAKAEDFHLTVTLPAVNEGPDPPGTPHAAYFNSRGTVDLHQQHLSTGTGSQPGSN